MSMRNTGVTMWGSNDKQITTQHGSISVDFEPTLISDLIKQANIDEIQRIVVGSLIILNKKLLLLQRSSQESFLPDLVELPSGKVEENEDVISGLVREAFEETGLLITKVKEYVNSFDYMSGSGKKARQFNFIVEVNDNSIKLNPVEHQRYYLVAQDDELINQLTISPEVRKIINEGFVNRKGIAACKI